MALAQVHFCSAILDKQTTINVILPDAGSGPFATFYLLHGLSDDQTIWLRRTRIEQYVRDLPLIVVMPDGGRGFYTDNNDGPAYATFFGRELPAFVERVFPAKSSRKGRCVGGLSMGGYGAMRLGLGYPEMFASVTSHSGALRAGQVRSRALSEQEWRRVFGDKPKGTVHDLLHLAAQAKTAGKLPKLRLDCGTEDFLLEDNRHVHRELERLGVPHEYAEYPGSHDWDYWDLHVRQAVVFHARALGLKA